MPSAFVDIGDDLDCFECYAVVIGCPLDDDSGCFEWYTAGIDWQSVPVDKGDDSDCF